MGIPWKFWTSSNKKIVTVDKNGKIKAGKKTGNAKITITLKSGKKATLKVKVQSAKVKTTKNYRIKDEAHPEKGQKPYLKACGCANHLPGEGDLHHFK